MPSSALLRSSSSTRPSFHLLSSTHQRLLSLRQLSIATNNGKQNPQSSSSSSSDFNSRSFILRWVSGIVVGSSLGALFYSLSATRYDDDDVYNSTSSSSSSSSSLFDALKIKSLPVFAEAISSSSLDSTPYSFSFKKPNFLFRDAYRRKVFFNYEKRIRLRSPPEKVFEYFASVRNADGETMMTPADLMRAIVPVFPPSESQLVREGFLPGERRPGELRCPPSDFFMLFDVNSDGLISFKEYIFFVTLLSIPESSFSVAFKMFDINNSGEIDRDEFKKVMALMRNQNRQGATHREGRRAGIKVGGSVENGGVVEFFFGEDGKTCLHHDKFVQFLRQLKDEILRLEFSHYDYKSQGSISAKDFALSMVASADIKHVNKLLDRVDELDTDLHLSDIRISEDEFLKFAELRQKLEPFSLALFAYGKANGLLTRTDFQRAASQVCSVPLSDNVVSIIYHVFDENRDGSLTSFEFLRILQKREKDIAQPVETGMLGFLSCCRNCAHQSSFAQLFS